jgi:uncharacterized RDD family membrane protein YckC
VSAPGAGRAGVVTRVLAAFVDVAVVVVLTVVLYLGVAGARFAWSPVSFTWPQPTTAISVQVAGLLATVYLTAAWATTGRTYGAALMGLRVLSVRGSKLGWALALVRALTCIVFPVGLLWSAVSRTRCSLQDLVLRSVVVYDDHRDGGVRVASVVPAPGTRQQA